MLNIETHINRIQPYRRLLLALTVGCTSMQTQNNGPVRGVLRLGVARVHPWPGEPALIAGYLGTGVQFDEAGVDFATAYAEQNERDYKALVRAAQQGRIEVYTES